MKINDVQFSKEGAIVKLLQSKTQVYSSNELGKILNISNKLTHYYCVKNNAAQYKINPKCAYFGSKEAIKLLRLRHEKLINDSIKSMEDK